MTTQPATSRPHRSDADTRATAMITRWFTRRRDQLRADHTAARAHPATRLRVGELLAECELADQAWREHGHLSAHHRHLIDFEARRVVAAAGYTTPGATATSTHLALRRAQADLSALRGWCVTHPTPDPGTPGLPST